MLLGEGLGQQPHTHHSLIERDGDSERERERERERETEREIKTYRE